MITCNPNKTESCGREAFCVKNVTNKKYFCMCPQNSKPLLNRNGVCEVKVSNVPPKRIEIMLSKSALGTSSASTARPLPVNTTSVQPNQLTNNTIAYVAAGLIILLAAMLCVWRFLCRKLMSRKHKPNKNKVLAIPLRKNIILEERYTTNPQYTSTGVHSDNLPIVPIIERTAITDLQQIGEGFFGKVYKGQLRIIDNNGIERTEIVAVKMLKQTTNLEAEEDFMREVEIMSSFSHLNILSFIGLCPREILNSPWMVFEYMPFGDLASVLRNDDGHEFRTGTPASPKLSSESLLSIASQISDGMAYLAKQRFVHRDLACRNCLVGSDLIVKIADFGLSRDVYTCDYYKIGGTKMLPVRWMAPESIIYGRFTLESDIWSYGVVLWEIYNYGKQPYFGHSNDEVFKFIIEGILLDIPKSCPKEVANIMKACWKKDTKERIMFSEISNRLSMEKADVFQQNLPCFPRPPPMPIIIDHPALLENADEDKSKDVFDEDNYPPPKLMSQSLSSMEYLELLSSV